MEKYLKRHAEPESALLDTLPGQWQHAVVTPAYREQPNFLSNHSFAQQLLIVVLNRPDTNPETAWAKTLIESLSPPIWRHKNLSLHPGSQISAKPQGDVLLVDRCLKGPPLPAKQGVGLARKIGCDIACTLFHRRQLTQPWIGSSDADAKLPPNYPTALDQLPPDASAAVFPFTHTADATTEPAIRAYELHMLHYVAGLRFAGSAYAFPTIGSSMAIHLPSYAQVHGFPKRSGGEDFYLLDKLAKHNGVLHCGNPTITLESRLSDRVPFGTGPALQKILASHKNLTTYNPRSFQLLNEALATLARTAIDKNAEHHALPDINPQHLHTLWQQFGCNQAIQKAWQQHRCPTRRLRALLTWFDSFKTLKWIHAARTFFPDVPLQTAIQTAPWFTQRTRDMNPGVSVHKLQVQLADGRIRGPAISAKCLPGN